MMALYKLIKKNNYSIVHIHQNSASMAMDAFVSRLCGVKCIIGHSHNTSCNVLWQHYLLKPFVNTLLTDRFACSYDAGKWVFGKAAYRIVNNAVDAEAYSFNMSRRTAARRGLNIFDDRLVVGVVGRLHEQKNVFRVLELAEALNNVRSDYEVVIVGDGELRGQIATTINNKGLESKVRLLGRREDIKDLMSAFDVFLMPSLYEGLPVVLVEAQAAGLPCLISDRVPMIDLIGNYRSLSLDASNELWLDTLLSLKPIDREQAWKKVRENNYDIKTEAKKLQDFYLSKS